MTLWYHSNRRRASMHARWDPCLVRESAVVHHYNPQSSPRKSALKRGSGFDTSPYAQARPTLAPPQRHPTIHPFLARSDRPALIWDITLPPDDGILPFYDPSGMSQAMNAPAIDTRFGCLDVVHKGGGFRTTFRVAAGYAPPQWGPRQPFVTVADVIYSLHRDTRWNITQEDFSRLCQRKGDAVRDCVVQTYWDRCGYRRNRVGREHELDKGILMVDLFLGSLTWGGLTVGNSPQELRLHLRPGRPMERY